jgi:putative membrane protein
VIFLRLIEQSLQTIVLFCPFIVIVSSGIAIIKIDFLEEIQNLGWVFIFIGPALLVVGVLRFFYVREKIEKYYTFEGPEG